MLSNHRLVIDITYGFNRVQVLYSDEITWDRCPELFESLFHSLLGLTGGEEVVMNRYSATITVARHIIAPGELAASVFDVVFEDDGDVTSRLRDRYAEYLIRPPTS